VFKVNLLVIEYPPAESGGILKKQETQNSYKGSRDYKDMLIFIRNNHLNVVSLVKNKITQTQTN